MIEQGFVQLINAAAAVTDISAQGGFLSELPKDQALPSWTYRFISDSPNSSLTTAGGLTMARIQIDCYGAAAVDALNLAHAIDHLIHGYRGTLSDPDSTIVDSISRADKMDFFDDARRSYRRMLEYEVWYVQP